MLSFHRVTDTQPEKTIAIRDLRFDLPACA